MPFAGGIAAKRRSKARNPGSFNLPCWDPRPCCSGSAPSSTSSTRRDTRASAMASPFAVALVVFDFDSELVERPIEERFGRGRALLAALAVERPAEHGFGAAIAVGLRPPQPFVDQRRLAGAAFRHQREDVDGAAGPGIVKALKFSVAADEALVGGLGQAGDVDIGGPRNAAAAARNSAAAPVAAHRLWASIGDFVGRRPPCAAGDRCRRSMTRSGFPSRGRRFLSVTLSKPALGVGVNSKRIEMNRLAARLPLADDRDFLVDDVVATPSNGPTPAE